MIEYIRDGLYEIEDAIRARRWSLADRLAQFLERKTGSPAGRLRLAQAIWRGPVRDWVPEGRG